MNLFYHKTRKKTPSNELWAASLMPDHINNSSLSNEANAQLESALQQAYEKQKETRYESKEFKHDNEFEL